MKIIPLWIKGPIATFLSEAGKIPCHLILQHMRCNYAESRVLPQSRKEEIYKKREQTTYNYLSNKYRSFIETQAPRCTEGIKGSNFPIWIFWWQGASAAPEIVQICMESVRKNANGHPVHIVDSTNYQEFVDIPKHILDKLQAGTISLTHFSDILRMSLIATHGGFWLDATIFYTKEIGGPEFDRPIFSGRNPNGDLSNISRWNWTGYAIYGRKDGALFRLVRDLFDVYWREHDRMIDYFLIDYFIKLVYDHCPAVREQIDAIPKNNTAIYYLQEHFNEAYIAGDHDRIVSGNYHNTWMFKLTWKANHVLKTEDGKDTMYAVWRRENKPQHI